MSYAQPSDLLARYDARVLGDLVNDAGTRQTPTQLLTDPNLAAALASAAGTVNAAALVGQRYTVGELSALTGDDLAFLVNVNCALAFGLLNQRRGNDPMKFPAYAEAREVLDMLRDGKAIFNVPADVAAGTPQDQFPSAAAYAAINLLRDAAGRYFAVRRRQVPASD